MDGAELLGSGRHVTQEQADSKWPTHQQDNDSQACDEMDEFQQASDRSFAFVKDPVQFWIQNKDRWPHVSRMALEIYGIPSSEADNERLYSKTGDMVTKKRSRLKASTIGAAQCLRQWDQDKIIEWR